MKDGGWRTEDRGQRTEDGGRTENQRRRFMDSLLARGACSGTMNRAQLSCSSSFSCSRNAKEFEEEEEPMVHQRVTIFQMLHFKCHFPTLVERIEI